MKQKRIRGKQTMAAQADRHVLYEHSVQNVAAEYKFVNKTFRKLRGRRPRHVREDFCGTASMCCEWVRRRKGNTAIGELDTPSFIRKEFNLIYREKDEKKNIGPGPRPGDPVVQCPLWR